MHPYNKVFGSIGDRLKCLGFTLHSENEYGATFVRPDGYHLIVTIERYSDGFSAEIVKTGIGCEGHFGSLFLMKAICPTSASKALDVWRKHGYTIEGVMGWWTVFLDFLEEYKEIVFCFPLPEPFRTRYQEVCHENMRELSLD